MSIQFPAMATAEGVLTAFLSFVLFYRKHPPNPPRNLVVCSLASIPQGVTDYFIIVPKGPLINWDWDP